MVERIRKRKPMESELAQVLCALGDPVRLDLVRKLAQQGEIPCGGFGLDMPKSSLSHHFRVLREAGVIGSRPEGTSTLNYLEIKQMEKRFPGLLKSVLGNL
jgi:DNA-binding transcriptional ArsR family regulator